MGSEFRIRLSVGFLVGLFSMVSLRELLETTFGWAGFGTALRAVGIGMVFLGGIAIVRNWKPSHVLGSLATSLVGAVFGLVLLFTLVSA